MTTTPTRPTHESQRMSTASRTALIIGLSLIAVATVLGVILVATLLRGTVGGSFESARNVEAGARVLADVPNASIDLRPSTDGQVHVDARGTYFGATPTLSVTTSDDVTTITGGCPRQWFGYCSLQLKVTMPASLPLTVTSQNGGLSAAGLTGSQKLVTTNGGIQMTGTRGDVELITTNGAIRVLESASRRVNATTTNGKVELDFAAPPSAVVARSTNGTVTVRVPGDDTTYAVDAHTTNGTIESGSVPTDPSSRRTITASTTNGNVTISRR
ncbi:DUF4097 family beta strand repeat-containing protein [Cryobacterium sp. TMT4-10]|uniref:DUF4097 family beta strand repeat-containing protein n=1 Tax=Cryobacterium sp. TMT4-10 TaxID=1259256 RepID=UPI00106993B6|nr:DUF4097 family beta strand repeat-containing protein [Cryobacterium sp. TMT4-10]TFD20688.1 hypothetical protein E3T42_01940 [Cryobacterium sp. TMT4-10]